MNYKVFFLIFKKNRSIEEIKEQLSLERVFLISIPIIVQALISATIGLDLKIRARLFGRQLENFSQYAAYTTAILVCIFIFVYILIRQLINIKDVSRLSK